MSILYQFDKLLVSQIYTCRLVSSIWGILINAHVLMDLCRISLILVLVLIILSLIVLHLIVLVSRSRNCC
jgi:hypothetical protein